MHAMTPHPVVIAGGGPTGLMLAAELRLGGVDALIVEPRATQDLVESRAGGLHARSLEVLDQRGVADRFVAAGQTHSTIGFAGMQLEIGDFPTRHNYTLGLWQADIERILAAWVLDELGAPILRERAVVGLAQDAEGVVVELSDGTSLRADYLVGCDGGRSVVRRETGIDFPGFDASSSYVIAEMDMAEAPPFGMRPEGGGIGLLDTYHAERHAVAARVIRNTMAQVALSATEDRALALRELTVGLLGFDAPRTYVAGMISALDVAYDFGGGHPLVGRRMPDLDVQTADGPTRVFTLLHDARAVLLNLDRGRSVDAPPFPDVTVIDASYHGAWDLPILGEVPAPAAVLIRPDGHVAWTA